jgi:hypothetical protein
LLAQAPEAGAPRKERWAALAGVAGRTFKEEIGALLRGDDWGEATDPGLERATRDL